MTKFYNRFRPRFSLQTLAIVVTLVCVYFGLWEVTKRYGVPAVAAPKAAFRSSPAPLVVRYQQDPDDLFGDKPVYYVWLFGPIFRLPFQPEPTPTPNDPFG
jgi:hypothetical protein